jgi:hypothetical protein
MRTAAPPGTLDCGDMNQSIPNVVEVRGGEPQSRVWRELTYRELGGISVHLYWNRRLDDVVVHVRDEWSDEAFVVKPSKQSALEAFYHPYALRQP